MQIISPRDTSSRTATSFNIKNRQQTKTSPTTNAVGQRACAIKGYSMADSSARRLLVLLVICGVVYSVNSRHMITKRNYSDQSVRGYLAERTCWWNEVCKEEFHSKFRCKCPRWSYCRAPGKYYDAHCSITRTGYIWTQPETSLGIEVDK